MKSTVFDVMDIDLAGQRETVLAGGRHLFPRLADAFDGISCIGVIGWGPQGRAQAMNLRDSLADTPIRVTVDSGTAPRPSRRPAPKVSARRTAPSAKCSRSSAPRISSSC